MLHIVANATSGSGAGEKALTNVQALLKRRGIPFAVSRTTCPNDAVRLTDEAMNAKPDGIVCLGGDGTIFEVVNGLRGRMAEVFFVPCGTGNDFTRMLHLPKDPVKALEAQLDGQPHLIDVGQVNDRYFLNISGGGFDVEVLKQAGRFKRLGKGILPYLLGIFAALHRFKPMNVEITSNGRTEKKQVTIISVGNGRFFGGGMMAVPHAEIDDGLFDVVIADAMNRLNILKLLSRFISGRHTGLNVVREFRTDEITIKCPGMTVNMDGELYRMDEAKYKILPGALKIRLPDSRS